MTPQRLVAAVAALAVGFGVTLVGVTLDDADDDAVATVESEATQPDPDVLDDAEAQDGVAEPAEQEEEVADEPEPAEVDAPVEVEDQAETDQSPQSQDAPANPAESAPATTVVMEIEEVEETDPFDGPLSGQACVDVVSLPSNRGFSDFVFISFRSESTIVLLGPEGRVVGSLPDDFDLEIVPREVTFDDGLPVAFGPVCSEDEPFGEVPTGEESFGESVAPCEGIDLSVGAIEIFEVLAPAYGDALPLGEVTELEAYRFLVAAVAERAADGSFFEFFDAVEVSIDGFRSECPFDVDSFADFDLIVDLFIDDDFFDIEYDEFLCNLGQLSADSRLIDLLDDRAEAFDTISCEYAEEA